jgi:hypothetical protein
MRGKKKNTITRPTHVSGGSVGSRAVNKIRMPKRAKRGGKR